METRTFMAYLITFRITIFVILGTLLGQLSHAKDSGDNNSFADTIDRLPGYSAQLSLDFCKANFPHHKIISRKVMVANTAQTFDLFAFTALPFDPKKNSVVAIHGGPGGLWAPNAALEMAKGFSDLNVIFFHYRGGGCSDFRTTSAEWDTLLTSKGVIADLEAIRKEYGILNWQGILAWSYGTNIARRYANRFPERTGLLILEGLDDPYHSEVLSADEQIQRVLSTIENRFLTSKALIKYRKTINVQDFISQLRDYFSEISPETNFGYAAAWDQIKGQFEEHYLKYGQQMPRYLSLPTFQSVALLYYSGEEEHADYSILVLMDQFGVISLDTTTKDHLTNYLSTWDQMMFPYKYKDYVDIFNQGMLVSWRVQIKMTENDQNLSSNSLCTSKSMIVLNGTKDMATPIENSERYLKNKRCAQGTNIGLTIVGGGHSSLGSMDCLSKYVSQAFLTNRASVSAPKGCSVPVTLKSY